eukprot:CAMPEP_0119153750 /NCGR_PEP_ID=MMETSP1310-20130426/49729_1 /TAXON_ID=464262 /ORGANISM="Genus nov. species nov., Strain RCC2339" /LENGTH=85 /DNA_ID=CAMNT_0007146223 /DNA_START=11 /DNA_END=265 /DNA_ORIENTATION=-
MAGNTMGVSLEALGYYESASLTLTIEKVEESTCLLGGNTADAYEVTAYAAVYRQAGLYSDGSAGELTLTVELDLSQGQTRLLCLH